MSAEPKIIILGAGITGLSAAYELTRLAAGEGLKPEITVLEASSRVGGKVKTEAERGFVIEAGPDSFITAKPYALELIAALGLSDQLVKTNPGRQTIYIYSAGRLQALPAGTGLVPTRLWSFLRTGLFSWKALLRLACEPLVKPSRGDEDESIAAFIRRRLGSEILDKMAAPMLGGIYAGDCESLSLQSTFPQLKEAEAKGGLVKMMNRSRRQPPKDKTMFMTLKGGLASLTQALASSLPADIVRTGTIVTRLERREGLWRAHSDKGILAADGVISALPANALAAVAGELDMELAAVLGEIPFVSTATVSMSFEPRDFPFPLEGFGFVVPRAEGLKIAAATFSSAKFPGRAPEGRVLVRCFLGGAGREEIAEADDEAIAQATVGDMREIFKSSRLTPRLIRVFKWPKANPQYTVGHSLRLKRIESCLRRHPGLVLAGCSYDGVGIADCVHSGRLAGETIFNSIARRRHAGT